MVVSVIPKHGCEQLFWRRELALADDSLNQDQESLPAANNTLNDTAILKWFKSETDTDIRYTPGKGKA